MDSAKLILTEAVSLPSPLRDLGKIDGISEEKKKQAAKDFESIFVYKLMDEMKNTIGEWSFEKDAASKQIQGIFSLCMSRHIADNGGFGLWKDVYQFLTNSDKTKSAIEAMGKNI